MVVDDSRANLKVLEHVLGELGYTVRSFPSGRLALAAADREPPDVILLDIDMPEMNGFEVCEHLKSSARLSAIPVIFLSGLSEIEDKIKAFRAGGVDYIAKPFRVEEVRARVETHLKLHNLQQTLKRQNEHLEEVVAARTQELAQAYKRVTILDRSKNDFLRLISHELRTPLNGLLGISELIMDGMVSTEEIKGVYDRSRQRILSILDDATLLTQINVSAEQSRSTPVSLHGALSRAIDGTTEFAMARRVALSPAPEGLDLVLADEDLLVRALQALLETAVKFSEEGETVRLSRDDDSRSIVIESLGRTISGPALEKFFDIFSTGEVNTPGEDLGLGPPVACRILSLFGSSVTVTNRDPSGIRLIVSPI